MTTFAEFQDQAASEKISLVVLEASRRLMGWEVFVGSVYVLENFVHQALSSIKDSGTALTAGTDPLTLAAGTYYHDRANEKLYLRTSDSVNPNGKFLALVFKNFYANVPVSAPYDLSTGYRVDWYPYLRSNSEYGVEIDNKNLIGFAIEGSGKVDFVNEQSYWKPIFDKWTFENGKVLVYSWNRDLAITEAKLVYRGRIQAKDYAPLVVSFTLKDLINELRAPVPLVDLSEVAGALIPPNLQTAKQRVLYGYLKGYRPTNIDQSLPLTGYVLTGTVTGTAASAAVTGSGTSFLAKLSPGDEVLFGSDTTKYTVSSIASDTALTLTEPYAGTTAAGKALAVFPSHPKRYMNRVHLLAGHCLKEPSTTVTLAITTSLFEVADSTDFAAGDSILVNSESLTVSRVAGNQIKTSTSLALLPTVGDTVKRLTVSSVYLNNRLLQYSRDYTYSPTTAKITLDQLAEFNVAPVKPISGTVSFTSGSRAITGSGTFFTKQIAPGDWVKRSSQSTWYEVLSVETDTAATLRSNAGYTSSGTADLKNPEVYDEGKVVLSLDTIGGTEEGTISGTLVKTAAQTVKALLTLAGLSAEINSAAFTVAQGDNYHKLGIAIPANFGDTKAPPLREVINKINQSVLGSLYQNEDFEFEYAILSPKRDLTTTVKFNERDVLSFKIASDSARIVKTMRVRYKVKEFDSASLAKQTSEVTHDSDTANYLAGCTKEQIVETYLVDETQAQILCNRWSFLFERASATVTVNTKLQGARVAVNDRVELNHEKMYERFGSSLTRKVGGVQAARKSISASQLEVEDLANAFSRCAAIAPSGALAWEDSSDDDKLYNGYITDSYGMQDNDPATHGSNLIW